MSRTFRKKGYELKYAKEKLCTKMDGYNNGVFQGELLKKGLTKVCRFYIGMPWWTIRNFRYYAQEGYYNPSKQEFYKEYYRIHGETKRSDSEFRKLVNGWVNKKNRTESKKQLFKFMKDNEYEVLLNRKETFVNQWFWND